MTTAAPRKRTAAPPATEPLPTDPAEAAEVVAERRRRAPSLIALPAGWNYAVSLVRGDDSIQVLPSQTGDGFDVTVMLGDTASTAPAPDLGTALETARQILREYAAYSERRLAFETSLGALGGTIGRAHVDANSAVIATDPTTVVQTADSTAAPTLAESQNA